MRSCDPFIADNPPPQQNRHSRSEPVIRAFQRISASPSTQGFTGLRQVSGRRNVTGDDRVNLDCTSGHNWCFLDDPSILAHTSPAVVCSRWSR